MRGFIGRNGKAYSANQRKAIFARLLSEDRSLELKIPHNGLRGKNVNRFVVGIDDAIIGATILSGATEAAGGVAAVGGTEAAGAILGGAAAAGGETLAATGAEAAGSGLLGSLTSSAISSAGGAVGSRVANTAIDTTTNALKPIPPQNKVGPSSNIIGKISGTNAALSEVGALTGAYDYSDLPTEIGREAAIYHKQNVQEGLQLGQDILNNPLAATPGGMLYYGGRGLINEAKADLMASIVTAESAYEGAKGTVTRAEELATPAVDTAALVAGTVAGSLITDLSDTSDNGDFGPRMQSNSEYINSLYMSKSPDKVKFLKDDGYIDVEKVRDLVKKEYPRADVDMDVKLLSPGEYTKFALEENPGREHEAVTSNGFYSPVYDAAFLEKDKNKLNTLRAMIHEMVHDMSDDGVNDDGSRKKYMLNEGYGDYIAKKIMTKELNIPEPLVNKTIGYTGEMQQVENLVRLNGRKKVDDAFLVKHNLDGLKLW